MWKPPVFTEQDKRMSCKNCGRKKSEHEDPYPVNRGRCTTATFRYDPSQSQNYRALCATCGTTGQAHLTLQGCGNFVPEPWDERLCRYCSHFGFLHRTYVTRGLKKTFCQGKAGGCECENFDPGPSAVPPPVTPAHGRYAGGFRDSPAPLPAQGLHQNCAYAGTCVANLVDPHTRRCM